MKSIMQRKDGTCYLCEKLLGDSTSWEYVEEHHVFDGIANRKLSEKHGLKVYLCVGHHRIAPGAVHNSRETSDLLKAAAQRKFEETHTRKEFMDIFGRNWLEEE